MSAKLLDILFGDILVIVCSYQAATQVGQGTVSAERQKTESLGRAVQKETKGERR